MKQYNLKGNQLELIVKPSPIIIRIIILVISIITFIMPLVGLVLRIAMGDGFHFAFLIAIAVFGYLGFYLLKIVLWNSYGKEVITLNKANTTFVSDFKFFQNKVDIENLNITSFSYNQVGYEEENFGTLVIGDEDNELESVVKIPLNQLEELIVEILNTANNK